MGERTRGCSHRNIFGQDVRPWTLTVVISRIDHKTCHVLGFWLDSTHKLDPYSYYLVLVRPTCPGDADVSPNFSHPWMPALLCSFGIADVYKPAFKQECSRSEIGCGPGFERGLHPVPLHWKTPVALRWGITLCTGAQLSATAELCLGSEGLPVERQRAAVGYDGRGCRVDSTDTREGQKWRISPKQ